MAKAEDCEMVRSPQSGSAAALAWYQRAVPSGWIRGPLSERFGKYLTGMRLFPYWRADRNRPRGIWLCLGYPCMDKPLAARVLDFLRKLVIFLAGSPYDARASRFLDRLVDML